tara:strand:- start:4709 stop:4921 length:213 start_codon:yes stop_codon:yes gene_type:complete
MDIKKTLDEFRNGLNKLVKINTESLKKIQHHEPEKVADILKDQSTILKAIKNNDTDTLNKLKKKYADNSN